MPRRAAGGGAPGRSRSEAGPVAFPAVPPVGVVGPGRAGLALAVALRRARIPVAGVHGRRERPVPAGLRLSVGGTPPWLERVGVVVCAVGDDALAACAAQLAASPGSRLGQVVLHLSGTLTHEVLAPLAAQGAATGSMHPLMSLGDDPARAARRLRGASFTLEGDVAAVGLADAIVRRVGGVSVPLAPELKPRYHAGAVFASNYLVTLLGVATRLLEDAGMPPGAATAALLPLARATIENVEASGPAAALTGPVRRGDAATLRRHLASLDPATAELYRAIGRATVRLAREAGLDAAQAAVLEEGLRVR